MEWTVNNTSNHTLPIGFSASHGRPIIALVCRMHARYASELAKCHYELHQDRRAGPVANDRIFRTQTTSSSIKHKVPYALYLLVLSAPLRCENIACLSLSDTGAIIKYEFQISSDGMATPLPMKWTHVIDGHAQRDHRHASCSFTSPSHLASVFLLALASYLPITHALCLRVVTVVSLACIWGLWVLLSCSAITRVTGTHASSNTTLTSHVRTYNCYESSHDTDKDFHV
jgi:hypothetical protein